MRTCTITFVLALALAGAAHAQTSLVVDHAGTGDFTTIQAAIDATVSHPDSEIVVRPGTYVENINLSGKAVTLRAHDPDPANTIIDGNSNGSVITCASAETPDTVISGLTITNGSGTFVSNFRYGGGLYTDAFPTITRCRFVENNARVGGGAIVDYDGHATFVDCEFDSNHGVSAGGVYTRLGEVTLDNCTFRWNTALNYGAVTIGPYGENTTISRCRFEHNSAPNGAGLAIINGTPTVTACLFLDNYASSHGGALYNWNSSATVAGCTFQANRTDSRGGAVYNTDASPSFHDCVFRDNYSDWYAGGMYNASWSAPLLDRCRFLSNSARNYGGGMYNDNSDPQILDCLFRNNSAGSSGGGIYNRTNSDPVVTRCLFAANNAGSDGGGIYNYTSDATVFNSVFVGGTARDGGGVCNIYSSDSLLVNCTLAENSASGTGASVSSILSSNATVVNCIMWNNDTEEIDYSSDSTTTVSYSIVQGGFTGTQVLDVDPEFARLPDDGGDGFGDDLDTAEIDESANDDLGDLRLSPAHRPSTLRTSRRTQRPAETTQTWKVDRAPTMTS